MGGKELKAMMIIFMPIMTLHGDQPFLALIGIFLGVLLLLMFGNQPWVRLSE